MKRLCLFLVALSIACREEPPNQPTPLACPGTPGVTCFGAQQFVEYTAGELPIVISVPHGGAIAPAGIPDRTVGTNVTDSNTIDLARAIVQAFQARTGRAPHLVLCHLRRSKLDANRDVAEAAQGNPDAVRAWNEYHGFVDQAARAVVARHARGLYVDLHGHGHPTPRLELGYMLSSSTLGLSDLALNTGTSASQSSLRLVMTSTSSTFAEVLRGPTSVGGLLGGYTASVPEPGDAVARRGSVFQRRVQHRTAYGGAAGPADRVAFHRDPRHGRESRRIRGGARDRGDDVSRDASEPRDLRIRGGR